jgi:hypothetical protein
MPASGASTKGAGDKRSNGASVPKSEEPAAKKGRQEHGAKEPALSKPDYAKSVFVPMCADFIHVGHINILEGAAAYGPGVGVLMTDEAMKRY